MVDNTALDRLARMRTDLPYFGKECLKIRAKDETTVPFEMNAAQRMVHDRIEAQKAEKGWVRAMVLKGRQQGISTYVGARFYNRSSLRRGVNVYILSHEATASANLFNMVDRYQKNNPIAPHVGISNAKELVFDKLDSTYVVATAGTKAGGRSRTVSLFHGSEVAFWENAPDHFAAAVQGVPLMPGTEVILESTSAGEGGEFYERWQDAEAGESDYIAIFLPWWLSPEYARPPPPGFVLSQEREDVGNMSEQEYADTWKLSMAQMAWRRAKIIELRSIALFKREYPADASEAWTAPPGKEPFIDGNQVLMARQSENKVGYGPLIFGVDPASGGGDRFAVAARRGLTIEWVKYRNRIDTLEGTSWIRDLIDEFKPARVNIDAGNIGAAIITNLKAIGPQYALIVRGVNFGATSEFKTARPKVAGPFNRRAEMWMRMSDWLLLPERPWIPNMPQLQADMTAPRKKNRLDNNWLLESKDDMKKRRIRSPDLADACALTFAFNEFLTEYHQPTRVVPFGNADSGAVSNASAIPLLPNVPTGWMG